MRRFSIPAAVLLAALTSASAAMAQPAALPTVTRTLTADSAVKRTCASTADRAARGVAISSYTAPISGYLTARLAAASTSDWDLVAIDAASGRRLATSEAFRSNEVVQTWAIAGQKIDLLACRRRGADRTARLSLTLLDVVPPTGLGVASLIRVHAPAKVLDGLSRRGFDVTESRGANWADVIVNGAKQRDALAATHLRAQTRVADLGAYDHRVATANAAYTRSAGAAGSPLPSGRTTYRTPADVQEELKALAEQHPDLVKPVTLGQTFQGRDVQGVEIANDVAADDGRPVFFLMAMHHAREWPTVDTAMEYAQMMANGSGDKRIATLLRKERTTVVPIVNVDGYTSTRTNTVIDPRDNYMAVDPTDENGAGETLELGEAIAPPGGVLSYRRKNCDGEVPDGNVPCELQWGVDNNRNYGNLWGGPGSDQDPTSQSYHGPAPRSEPETQAVWNYSRTHQVTALISLHTVAALVLRPPGEHTAGKAPDETAMKDLGDRMADATGYTSEYGFQLYDTAGTTEDDTYAAEGGYGYTIEMGPEAGPFHGPYESAVVDQWTRGDNPADSAKGGLREALLLAGETAARRASHSLISGKAPAGAVLRLHKDFDTMTSEFCVIGAEPVVEPGLPVVGEQASAFLHCPNGWQDPQAIKDNIDTTTTVPASGAFHWDVNPSTRPFVGGGALVTKLSDEPLREETVTGTPSADNYANQYEDHDFTIKDGEPAVKINVNWITGEDYDVEVYRKNADGTLGDQVGSSGNAPGKPEEVVLTGASATPGNYVLRVVYFAAASDQWTATIGYYDVTFETTTGHPEAYTLTCEIGGDVVQSRQVYISRGERLWLGACGSSAPAVVHPGSDGLAKAGPPPNWPYAE